MGYRWDTTTLTYSFPTATIDYAGYAAIDGFASFSTAQKNAVHQIMAYTAAFAV